MEIAFDWFAETVEKACAMLTVKKAAAQSGDVALMESVPLEEGFDSTRGSINRASLATNGNKSLPPETGIMKHSPQMPSEDRV